MYDITYVAFCPQSLRTTDGFVLVGSWERRGGDGRAEVVGLGAAPAAGGSDRRRAHRPWPQTVPPAGPRQQQQTIPALTRPGWAGAGQIGPLSVLRHGRFAALAD